ncbi:ankyrin repeat-containing protein At5g02620-like [Asparagus officinalis]|uniref:ankyrin repeat-containing protein At5g02620-like n=1 Tax=Asparagus officinalis TaxID=4686 RepID=UPI00098DE69E|nr:ankyrin repeat-containing protein At5g02620-like [Asparagus officinalis]
MERSISFQLGVIERQSSLRTRVVDQRSSTTGLIENEQGLQEKKIEKVSGRRGETPLHLAVNTGSLPKVEEILLGLKANGLMEKIWEENNEGQTALCVAAKNGNVEIVREILKAVCMQSADPDRSCGAFHVAAKLGHAEVLKALLYSFPELVTTTNLSNTTALYTAASQGHIEVVDLLLEADVAVARIVRNNGKTALHIAARMDHQEVVKLLLSKDPVIVLMTDRKGQTALHMAGKGQSAEIVRELLGNAPFIINLADNKGNTALHIATRKGRSQIVQALLSFPGIDINASNKAGETALQIAEKYFNEEIATVLRETGGCTISRKEEIEEIEEVQVEEVLPLPPSTPNQLKQAVSFLRQEVKLQLQKSRRTQMGVDELKKKVGKMIKNGLDKANNSNIVVATLIFSSAFAAIFQVPGQYTSSDGDGYSLGCGSDIAHSGGSESNEVDGLCDQQTYVGMLHLDYCGLCVSLICGYKTGRVVVSLVCSVDGNSDPDLNIDNHVLLCHHP